MRNITENGINGTSTIGHKKCRNYGNAANQVLFPLGNDNAKVEQINIICKS